MQQYLVLGHDGTDAGAPARRAAAQAAHRANVAALQDSGMLMLGGPVFDETGAAVGSACIANVRDRAELDAWLASDPYVTQGVWQRIEVRPMRIADAPER